MVAPDTQGAPVPLPRLIRAVTLLQAPVWAAILAGMWAGLVTPVAGAGVFVASAAAAAYLIRRHLSGLEALRIQVENLARDTPGERNYTPPIEIPTTAAGLGQAVANLDRSWVQRGESCASWWRRPRAFSRRSPTR